MQLQIFEQENNQTKYSLEYQKFIEKNTLNKLDETKAGNFIEN